MASQATVEVTEREYVPIVSLAGDVDLSFADELTRGMRGVAERRARAAVLDLSEVTFLDSAGLHLVFGLRRRLARRGARLAVVLPRDRKVRQIFALVDAVETLDVHASLADALAYCREEPGAFP